MANEKRLIDAYTLAEEIESLTITVAGKPAKWNDAKHSILRILAEQPDVDAVEVVHGRWNPRPHNRINEYGKVVKYCDFYYCSECGTERPIVPPYKYCPNCGAKMDGERREGE